MLLIFHNLYTKYTMHTMTTVKTMRNVAMIIITSFSPSPTVWPSLVMDSCVVLGSSVFFKPKETDEELEIA